MNYKLEKFWNVPIVLFTCIFCSWTINLKSFEILGLGLKMIIAYEMNYKLEKFWNKLKNSGIDVIKFMNYKLEKFWNLLKNSCNSKVFNMNYKLEKFWNKK